MIGISLETIFGGELGAKFQYAIRKVVNNILDPNTSTKKKRRITISLIFESDDEDDRSKIKIVGDVNYTLAPPKASKSTLVIGRDAVNNELYIQEVGASIPGQMDISNYQTDINEDYRIPSADADAPEVIDFRKK